MYCDRFSLGYQTSTVKMIELTQAIGDGADELDVVINLGMVKNRLKIWRMN